MFLPLLSLVSTLYMCILLHLTRALHPIHSIRAMLARAQLALQMAGIAASHTGWGNELVISETNPMLFTAGNSYTTVCYCLLHFWRMSSVLVKTSFCNVTWNLLQDLLTEAWSRLFPSKGVVAPLLLGGVSLMMTLTSGLLTLSFFYHMAISSSWCAEHKGIKSSFVSPCDAASLNLWVTYW